MANNKHLSLSDRITIESMLEKHHTFKEIGSFLDKDPVRHGRLTAIEGRGIHKAM